MTLLKTLFPCFALSLFASSLSTVFAEDTPVPTEITSTAFDMWNDDPTGKNETHGIFTGNVVVTGTNLKMTCDRLELIATRLGDKNVTVGKIERFKYLLATGNVRIVQSDREAHCGRAEVFPREDKIILTEKPVVIDGSSGSVATGEPIELYRGERRVKGDNVKFTFPPIKDLGPDKNQAPTRPSAPAAPEPATK